MTSSNACSGVLGWIAILFGSSTPTYVGDGQPAASCGGGWSLFGNAPAYVVAPAEPAPVPVPTAGAQPPSCPPDAGNGAVTVTANANRELLDIQFDREKLDWDDPEMVQDLIIAAVNKALEKAAEKEAEEAQNIMKNMLPPGMGDLGGLFG